MTLVNWALDVLQRNLQKDVIICKLKQKSFKKFHSLNYFLKLENMK